MTRGPLSADDIRRLFGELASELDAAGQRAEIFLVGGAAIALCFDARRATRDLDAVFAATDSVRRAAANVAYREGLDPDWLNDAVKGFLPGPDPNAVRYFEAPGLLVDVASAEYLLAMKLFSSRWRPTRRTSHCCTAKSATTLLKKVLPSLNEVIRDDR